MAFPFPDMAWRDDKDGVEVEGTGKPSDTENWEGESCQVLLFYSLASQGS